MSTFREAVIKLAQDRPELRKHLVPIFRGEKVAMDFPTQEALDKYLKDHPDADRANHKVVEKKDEPKKDEPKKDDFKFEDYLETARAFVFDFFHDEGQGNYSDANDLMKELEGEKTVEGLMERMKFWGVKKKEINSFLDEYVKDDTWTDEEWAGKRKELEEAYSGKKPTVEKRAGEDWLVTPAVSELAEDLAREIKRQGGKARLLPQKYPEDYEGKNDVSGDVWVDDDHMVPLEIELYEGSWSHRLVVNASFKAKGATHRLPIMGQQAFDAKAVLAAVAEAFMGLVNWGKISSKHGGFSANHSKEVPMSTLREAVIKLAQDRPELRKHLVPILQRTAMDFPTQEALEKYLKEHPDADRGSHKVVEKKEEPAKEEKKEPKDEPKAPDKPHKKVKIQTKTLAKVQDVLKANGLNDDSDSLKELGGFKGTLGQRVPDKDKGKWFARNAAQLKADFVKNMDPSNYDNINAFKAAQERIKKMTPDDFGKVLAAINEDEDVAAA